ncbi:MAG: hypothetical protein KAY65_13215 [Planctomycetes bacterium]|nr:hypothetical protein [Planctomycetota bacterium]
MRRLRRAKQRQARKSRKLKRRFVAAGAAAAITLGAGVTLHKALGAPGPDPHQLPVAADADADLLADAEEAALAYLDFEPDQNRNGTSDGVELAKLCAADINDLPFEGEAGPDETYKREHWTFGLETCDYCPTQVNMGFVEIVNPKHHLTVACPFISLHYMEHGSFSYAGTVHSGRLDLPALLQALELRLPYEPNDHQLPVAQDADADLLAGKEELAIGYKPFDPDQNRNEIPDGIELAKRCAAVVAELPSYPLWPTPPDTNEIYKVEHALDGLERCYVCGQDIHMGGWEIINPKLAMKYPDPNDPLDRMFLPDLALHYMQHGSFDCYGHDHKGRVNIPRLLRVLELRYPHDPNEHQLPLDYVVKPVGQLAPDANDLDADLLADSEELAAGYNLHDPDQDDDLTPDGIELAKQCAAVIDELPVYSGHPPPAGTYKVELDQWGLEYCPICGESVNMGGSAVVNPKLGVSIYIDRITIHYMRHGSFSYHGLWQPGGEPQHAGRIDLALLVKILEMPRHCGDLGTLYLPGDSNKDCRQNFTDFADSADKWLECTDPNQD